MELLAGIEVIIAVFLANFLVGKTISNRANAQMGINNEVQIMKGVDNVVQDTKNI